jgi:small subunit ribosomal protein S4
MGLIKKSAQLDDILSLTSKDIMERRLQTLVHRKGLAKSMKQARQFITHGHIRIKDKMITVPSYVVKIDEEEHISFCPTSQLASIDHPERVIKKKEEPKRHEKYRHDKQQQETPDKKVEKVEKA